MSQDGTPVLSDRDRKPKTKEPGWLTYAPEDAPPVTEAGPQMKMLIFGGGKCDWMRVVARVFSIDPTERRITLTRQWRGIGVAARFFLEDDLRFLDVPGEFFLDEKAGVLYYKPMGGGHPDTLGIAAPVLSCLIQINGKSRDACASNIRLEGLALEETGGYSRSYANALIQLANATNVEIRECHLKNGGRHAITMVGHNIGNVVTGCWIESMGMNGVTLSNGGTRKDKQTGLHLDRCEYNRVHNCHIHNVGEIHTYAECVTVFNVSHNEISHCELHDSVRYAVTVRGNTGAQYGPPVSTDRPPCSGNHMHHLRVYRCGQDGGDMGALHCAGLNNPGGGCVNTFEQITVADSASIPSMKDRAPDGIFLDWPKMAMDQIFTNVHIVRSQDKQIVSHGPDNRDSAQTTNVSWKPGFRTKLMDYENIGLTDQFPAEYGGRRAVTMPPTPPAPQSLSAKTTAYHTVVLQWRVPAHTFGDRPTYIVFRDGEAIALVQRTAFTDTGLTEGTAIATRWPSRTVTSPIRGRRQKPATSAPCWT